MSGDVTPKAPRIVLPASSFGKGPGEFSDIGIRNSFKHLYVEEVYV